jgi:hypothetical protein
MPPDENVFSGIQEDDSWDFRNRGTTLWGAVLGILVGDRRLWVKPSTLNAFSLNGSTCLRRNPTSQILQLQHITLQRCVT